jgi:hypothetical protein
MKEINLKHPVLKNRWKVESDLPLNILSYCPYDLMGIHLEGTLGEYHLHITEKWVDVTLWPEGDHKPKLFERADIENNRHLLSVGKSKVIRYKGVVICKISRVG